MSKSANEKGDSEEKVLQTNSFANISKIFNAIKNMRLHKVGITCSINKRLAFNLIMKRLITVKLVHGSK